MLIRTLAKDILGAVARGWCLGGGTPEELSDRHVAAITKEVCDELFRLFGDASLDAPDME